VPFGNKRFDPLIVGIGSDMGVNGIFYLPERTRISDLLDAAVV
jgi:hypothetical protein